MNKLTFANGEEFNCTLCATMDSENMVFIAIDGVDFGKAASLFSNPECTRHMVFEDYDLYGYTTLLYVMNESFGYKACLTGGHYVRNNR